MIVPNIGISDLGNLFIKVFALLGLGIYMVFALVVVQQTRLMIKTVKLGMEGVIILLSIVHLLFAAAVFILALTVL